MIPLLKLANMTDPIRLASVTTAFLMGAAFACGAPLLIVNSRFEA